AYLQHRDQVSSRKVSVLLSRQEHFSSDDLLGMVGEQELQSLILQVHISVLTLVAAVEDAWQFVGAFEVEKGGDRKDQEQADQQCSQKKGGCHTWPSCSKAKDKTGRRMTNKQEAMNHLKNIKQMLSIPTGSRNAAICGYNNLTDSQFFTGSQFWPENSQSASQEKSLSSRTSLQSSQEGSDPKFSNSYQTKPLLFGELKDKTRGFGILGKFEEDKKKATEKNDSNIFAKEYQHTRETLNNSGDTTAELASNLQSFKSNLESVREEQEREQQVLEEVLRLLSTLVSEHSAKASPQRLMDSAIQTSPVEQSSSDILQDNKLEGNLCTSCYCEPRQVKVPPQERSCSTRKRKLTHSLRGYRRCRRSPLVLSQRKGRNVPDENSQPLLNCNKQTFVSNVSAPRCEGSDPNSVTSRDSLNPEGIGVQGELSTREGRAIPPVITICIVDLHSIETVT
ncbi:hypothetical protein INR49_029640, partial [Caranx melampygus]